MSYYSKSVEQIFKELSSSPNGLSSNEANARLQKYGKNLLTTSKKISLFSRFFAQFKNIMIIVLLASALISIIVAIFSNKHEELFEGFLIFGIVFINAIIGTFQEKRASDAIALLNKHSEPYSKVFRDGKLLKIESKNLTIGDIVYLKSGDVIPADIRLFDANNFKCNESTLTGESCEVYKQSPTTLKKDTPLAEQTNMCFSGTSCTFGNAKGIVVSIGKNTEIGKIQKLLNSSKKEKTPLEKNIDKIGKIITYCVLAITAIVFIFQLIFAKNSTFLDCFLTAVALAVAAIPEGLPAVITIVMALGVEKLAKEKAIVKTLSSVETLGCCDIICSDKTGTLTQNKMSVQHLFINQKITTNFSNPSEELNLLYYAISLCNNAKIDSNGNIIGDATETALFKHCKNFSFSNTSSFTRIKEFPFDSSRKIMSTINKTPSGLTMFTKGAFDYLISKCSQIRQNGKIYPLTTKKIKEIEQAIEYFGKNAERVIAVAYKNINSDQEETENNLIFIGLVSLSDPPKQEAKKAIRECISAGLKPIMITGDHPETAFAIAKQLHIATNKNQVMTGQQLDKLSTKELSKIIENFSVFARVLPEHKVKIVKAFKLNKHVVAMTGDGVNDAPSLSSADIGTCMGITGTDVTKQVSDLIITDDNFSTIVIAVKQGRTIYSNIQKIIQFLISTNLVEVLGIFVCTLIMPNYTFLLPSQILFINLVTDSFPAFALGMEKPEKNIMNIPPRKSSENLFSGKVGTNIIYQSITQTLLVLIVFVVTTNIYGNEVSSTMAFLIICLMQIIHAINCKTQESIFKINIFNNLSFNISFIGLLIGILLVAFVPTLQNIFGITSLTLIQWLIVIATSISIIPIVELCKLIVNKYYLIKNNKK